MAYGWASRSLARLVDTAARGNAGGPRGTSFPRLTCNNLFLDLAKTRADRLEPTYVRQRWQQDRFALPSPIDPHQLADIDLQLWRLLPPQSVGLSLSPSFR